VSRPKTSGWWLLAKSAARNCPTVLDDRELLELFEDEPELLAIADALRATRPAAHTSRPRRRVLLAAAASAVVAAVAVLLMSGGGPSVVEQAAAAIPSGRLLESDLETEASTSVVDLSTGAARPVRIIVRSWLDSSSGRVRVLTMRDGVAVSDVAISADQPVPPSAGLDAASLTFIRSYKEAVEGGQATRLSTRELRIAAQNENARVRLGPHAKPVAVLGVGIAWRVTRFVGAPYSTAALRPRTSPRVASAGAVVGSTSIDTALARRKVRSLVGVALPQSLAGAPLHRAALQRLSRVVEGKTSYSEGAQAIFQSATRKVLVRVARRPEPAYGFPEGRFAFDFTPVASPGRANLIAIGEGASRLWIIQLRLQQGFATIRASSKAAALEAGRQLSPR
jgi:hypothetical protein